jgi:hypothetical protein
MYFIFRDLSGVSVTSHLLISDFVSLSLELGEEKLRIGTSGGK